MEFQKIASLLDCKSQKLSLFVARNCQELSSGLKVEHSQGIHQYSEMWESPNRRWRPRGPAEPVGQHGLSSFLHPLQNSRSSWKPKKKKRKASSWETPGERQSLRWLLCVGPTCFPWSLGPKTKSAKLTFSVAALKNFFGKTPESLITSYLTFDTLILLRPENQIQNKDFPTIYNPYNIHTMCGFTKRCRVNSLPHLCKESHLSLLSIEHSAAYVEVQPMWRSSAWIFLSPALVTRLHMFFISPHMFLLTFFL